MTSIAGNTQETDDAAIVGRVLAGEPQAYGILVTRHQDLLYRHALRMTRESDAAADLVQAAFVKAYLQLGRCRDPARFGAWAFRILANQAKDWLKSRRRRDVSLDATPHDARMQSDDDPERDVERDELRALLNGALAELPPVLREAFVLKHVEGLAYDEMALMLDVSIPAL
ncbi:MAG: RNA polymerase sigma factor, partial [Longimicrobiales bacterium]